MKIKYIVKEASSTHQLFIVKDAAGFNGSVIPFAFRDCEHQPWNIAHFDTKEEAVSACEEAMERDGSISTPVILEVLIKD